MKSEKVKAEFARVLRETEAGRAAAIERVVEGRRYVRRFVPEDRLILLGGGHIAVPLCAIASMLDFSVTVVDDRPSFANTSRFPTAAHVVCNSFPEAIRGLGIRPTDYVCVITRGHRWDADCLVFDFEKLDYVSSAGLRVLLSAHKTMNGKGGMEVIHVNEVVQEVFAVTGFADILNIK